MRGANAGRASLRVLVTVAFVPFIVFKLTSHQLWVERFTSWGYPGWGVLVISALEIVGLAGLWVPAARRYSFAVLVVVLMGAAATWLIHGPPQGALPAIGLLVLVSLLGWTDGLWESPTPTASTR
jgi:hypothetical protein